METICPRISSEAKRMEARKPCTILRLNLNNWLFGLKELRTLKLCQDDKPVTFDI